MEYSDYSYSSATQAAFFKAEEKLVRLDDVFAQKSYTKYLKEALLAIDAVFSVQISHEVTIPVVPLITTFDLMNWKQTEVTKQSTQASCSELQLPSETINTSIQALNYMRAMYWISKNNHTNTSVTVETVLHIHELLMNGPAKDGSFHGFRKSFLPYRKGFEPASIPFAINDLCNFINVEAFSPLGQASVVHHAFERIIPFDNLIDRSGLVLAFLVLFKRGLFSSGFMIPICWGTSLDREHRKKIRDASRDKEATNNYLHSREYWAVLNARNTYSSGIIAASFLDAVNHLDSKWRTECPHIPANSALDKLLSLFLGLPSVSARRAADLIGKSYGATNEALARLSQMGIIEEKALDCRERIFICNQSATMITRFVDQLIRIRQEAEGNVTAHTNLTWNISEDSFSFDL